MGVAALKTNCAFHPPVSYDDPECEQGGEEELRMSLLPSYLSDMKVNRGTPKTTQEVRPKPSLKLRLPAFPPQYWLYYLKS